MAKVAKQLFEAENLYQKDQETASELETDKWRHFFATPCSGVDEEEVMEKLADYASSLFPPNIGPGTKCQGRHSPSGSTRFYFLPAEFTFPPKNSAQHQMAVQSIRKATVR